MGYYLNTTRTGQPLPARGKATHLAGELDATELLAAPKTWQPDIVCVILGGLFEAAAWCFSQAELDAFNDPTDTRAKRWFLVPGVSKLFPTPTVR